MNYICRFIPSDRHLHLLTDNFTTLLSWSGDRRRKKENKIVQQTIHHILLRRCRLFCQTTNPRTYKVYQIGHLFDSIKMFVAHPVLKILKVNLIGI